MILPSSHQKTVGAWYINHHLLHLDIQSDYYVSVVLVNPLVRFPVCS